MSNNLIVNITQGFIKRVNRLLKNKYHKAGFSWPKEILVKHLPEQGEQTIRFLGKSLSFNGRNSLLHSLQEIFLEDIYKQSLPAKAYIIDCGANIGLSVIYLKKLCPDARIVAFEPDETNFSLLKKNIESFGLTDVEARKEAVWTADTEISFLQQGTLGSKIASGDNDEKYVKVKAMRLKDILNQPIDFLKLDIEGAEYQVIKDIATQLHFAHNLFLEYHGSYAQNNELNEILQVIVDSGFRYYIKEAGNTPSPFTSTPSSSGFDVQLNIFCTKSRSHAL